MKIHSFDPIADADSKILILGSMASVQSLEKNEYYGHPMNRFWRVLFALFEKPYSPVYADKLLLLHDRHIALWDTIASCERNGSMDKDIKNEEANDIPGFLREHPQIYTIVFNGQKSFDVFRKKHHTLLPCIVLPSTSPIPRKDIRNFDDLIKRWQIIKELLNT